MVHAMSHTLLSAAQLFSFYLLTSLLTCIVLCRLLEVRSRLYELMTHCIPPDVIMRVMLIAFHFITYCYLLDCLQFLFN